MDGNTLRIVAGQEMRIQLRGRTTGVFAIVFAVLATALAYFGLVTAGAVGFQNFARTTASLLNLVLYLVPILSLVMGALSLNGEKGETELLFSQPVSRPDVLWGKYAGLLGSALLAIVFGFGVSGIAASWQAGFEGLWRFGALAGLSAVLAAIFLAVGLLIAAAGASRSRALGASLFVWFLFVLFYDLFVIGLTFLLAERTANQVLFLAIFGNPVDLVRIGGLMLVGDPTVFGAAGASLIKFLGGAGGAAAAIAAGLLFWAAAPLAAARLVLLRRDL